MSIIVGRHQAIMMRKYFFLTAGLVSLGTGMVGIFLPVLPTTPFLLLSAACFLKSSQFFYNRLVNHRLFGRYIENYIKYRAITLKSKISSIVILWSLILISILSIDTVWIKILLGVIAVGVTIHLLLLKTMRKDTKNKEP